MGLRLMLGGGCPLVCFVTAGRRGPRAKVAVLLQGTITPPLG